MKIIEDWRDAPRLLSVQLSAIGALVAGTWLTMPEATQQAIIDRVGVDGPTKAVIAAFAAVIAGRLVKQRA